MYDSIWGEEDSDSHESPIESSDENNHDLPQNQTDARTNVNEDVNDYHDAQHIEVRINNESILTRIR